MRELNELGKIAHSRSFQERKTENSYQEKIKKLKQRTIEINQEIKELEAKLNPPKKGDKTD